MRVGDLERLLDAGAGEPRREDAGRHAERVHPLEQRVDPETAVARPAEVAGDVRVRSCPRNAAADCSVTMLTQMSMMSSLIGAPATAPRPWCGR